MLERDPSGLFEIAARVRVRERLLGVSVLFAPVCCPLQVDGEQLGMATLELGSEEFAEEVVVAVPLAAIVERDDERVRARKGPERIGGVVGAEHRVAEGRRHPVEDRCAEQERLRLSGCRPRTSSRR